MCSLKSSFQFPRYFYVIILNTVCSCERVKSGTIYRGPMFRKEPKGIKWCKPQYFFITHNPKQNIICIA